MKRLICISLAIALLCTSVIPVKAVGNHSLGLQSYLNTDNDEYLLRNDNYDYWKIIDEFESDIVTWELLNTIGFLTGHATEPDVPKYTEVLVNIIATFDRDNASEIAQQHKNDNLKTAKDYAWDIAKIGADAVSMMVAMDESSSELEEWISKAITGLSIIGENTDNWIHALSDMETIVQNYTSYDVFLEVVEDNANGDLRKAASNLRTSMEKAIKLKLETYDEVLQENYTNYTEFFFSDLFFDSLKLTTEYETDEGFQMLVDSGSDFADTISEFTSLQEAWDLGVAIGMLVGNVAVGGEDIINRLLELMALRDIGDILCDELNSIASNYILSNIPQEEAERYFVLSNYLIGCRIRGEYCRYSIVASDSGLLSKFGYKDAEAVKVWYQEKCARIMEIREAIRTAGDVILVAVNESGYEVGEISEWYVYDKSGNLYGNYTLRITSKEKMHIGAIPTDDFTHPTEHIVNTAEPLVLELEAGYWYGFDIIDNNNATKSIHFNVAVNQADGLIDMIDIKTNFGSDTVDSNLETFGENAQTTGSTETEPTVTEIVESQTGLHCEWAICGDYDGDGKDETYALTCVSSDDYTNGQLWKINSSANLCLFWFGEDEAALFHTAVKFLPDWLAVDLIQSMVFIDEWMTSLS